MTARLLLIALIALLPTFALAADTRPDYAGNYELAGKDAKRVFKLSLTQKGARVHAMFFAADLNQPGAQPMGEGDGRIDDKGILEFKFTDNLANKGVATLSPDKTLYRLEMRMITIVDLSPVRFYGVLSMKKVGDPDPRKTSVTAL